jgi:rhodanese-related sulfurtransferase
MWGLIADKFISLTGASTMKKRHLLVGIILFTLIFAPITVRGDGISENISASEGYEQIEQNRETEGFVILDVRTPEEYEGGRIEGSENIDYYGDDFRERIEALDKNRTYLVYCASGNRSGKVLKLMSDFGFKRVYNLVGGITRWQREGLPVKG